MLRGWGSERTLWLNPVLSDPQPVASAFRARSGRLRADDDTRVVVDLDEDLERRSTDLEFLRQKLDRPDF